MGDIHIPAHPLLLDGWCGPVLVTYADGAFAEVWASGFHGPDSKTGSVDLLTVDGGEDFASRSSALRERISLDLRRPEVQDQVSRVMWGASGARVVIDWSGHVQIYAGNAWRASEQWDHDILTVSDLATVANLPEADRLPTALRLCWMRWLEVRGA